MPIRSTNAPQSAPLILPLEGARQIAPFIALAEPILNEVIHEHGALFGDPNPERVHALRRSLRRVRALLGMFAHEFEPRDAAWIDRELTWVTSRLGPVRDIDVLRQRIEAGEPYAPETRAEDAAAAVLFQTRVRAMDRALAALGSARATVLIGGLGRWIERCGTVLADIAVLSDCVAPTLQQQDAVIRHAGRHLKSLDRRQRHGLRSDIKQLRYALEAFPALAARNPAYVASLAELHLILGDMNDDAMGDRLLARMVAEGALSGAVKHRPQPRSAQWKALLAAWDKLLDLKPDFQSAV